MNWKNCVIGIQRLPALLSTGEALADIGCSNYEISTCEPLHDLKNMIHHILNELPHHITNPQLRQQIKNFCESTLGMTPCSLAFLIDLVVKTRLPKNFIVIASFIFHLH